MGALEQNNKKIENQSVLFYGDIFRSYKLQQRRMNIQISNPHAE
jgi:hypothetical protein